MLQLQIEKSFKKDLNKANKSGLYAKQDFSNLKDIIEKLQNSKIIDSKYKRHQLKGVLKDFEAVHIKYDWVMIFQTTEKVLTLIMLGAHTQVYKKF